MSKPRSLTLSILAIAAVSTPMAQSSDDCAFEAERDLELEAGGAERIEIETKAGRLVVAGHRNLRTIRVRGRACAAEASELEAMQLVDSHSGNTIRLETRLPGRFGDSTAYLDVYIDVPLGLETEIDNAGGAIELHGFGDATVSDDSGALRAEEIAGSIDDARDGSGTISVRGATGNVVIRQDGTGTVSHREAAGTIPPTPDL